MAERVEATVEEGSMDVVGASEAVSSAAVMVQGDVDTEVAVVMAPAMARDSVAGVA